MEKDLTELIDEKIKHLEEYYKPHSIVGALPHE